MYFSHRQRRAVYFQINLHYIKTSHDWVPIERACVGPELPEYQVQNQRVVPNWNGTAHAYTHTQRKQTLVYTLQREISQNAVVCIITTQTSSLLLCNQGRAWWYRHGEKHGEKNLHLHLLYRPRSNPFHTLPSNFTQHSDQEADIPVAADLRASVQQDHHNSISVVVLL